MRKIFLLFAVFSAALLPLGHVTAQVAAGQFRRDFSTPTPTPTPSPTPPPKPAMRATASPKPSSSPSAPPKPSLTPKAKPQPTPQASVTPRSHEKTIKQSPVRSTERRRKALEPKPVRAVKPRRSFIRRIVAEPNQGPRASRPTFDFSETNWATSATFKSLENKWQSAVRKHDPAIVDDLLGEDFEGSSVTGKSMSKAHVLREIRQDKNVYKSIRLRGMTVRSKGSAVAVVTGIAIESGTTKDGRPFTHSRRFTDTWKEHGGKWKCLSSKSTSLPEKER